MRLSRCITGGGRCIPGSLALQIELGCCARRPLPKKTSIASIPTKLLHTNPSNHGALLAAATNSAFQVKGARYSALVTRIDVHGWISVVCIARR